MTTFDTRNGHVTIDTATHKAVPVNSIVLNPDSGVVWEFLQEHPRADQDHMTTNCLKGFLLAKEIRKQLPKPISQPTGIGAVVVDSQGRTWVRYLRPGSRAPWLWSDAPEGVEPVSVWSAIDAVDVLSEGVES